MTADDSLSEQTLDNVPADLVNLAADMRRDEKRERGFRAIRHRPVVFTRTEQTPARALAELAKTKPATPPPVRVNWSYMAWVVMCAIGWSAFLILTFCDSPNQQPGVSDDRNHRDLPRDPQPRGSAPVPRRAP